MTVTSSSLQRVRIRITGVVQGVGFRPFVYRLANTLNLRGFVGNDSDGVFIEIEGSVGGISQFQQRLRGEAPPIARIDSIETEDMPVCNDRDFIIVHSQSNPDSHTLISPDLSICNDCLRELFDPTNRRYRYPFINCTNCGPRFTITHDIPYDRRFTTMSDFEMCPACQAEYDDPMDRRFHAQPNACPECGPKVTYVQKNGVQLTGDDAVRQTVAALADGQIVAIKGIGGFHLACDATNVDTVNRLRKLKNRPAKPFALMARDLDSTLQFAEVSNAEAYWLMSHERPIVLLEKQNNAVLAEGTSPGIDSVGVMLPYTPLHYLIIGDKPLVMTSANLGGEPIIKDNDEALSKLADIADGFLLHNRDIHVHCDDSVVRLEYPIRRSRGYAPFPVKLPFELSSILAVGGELKSTFCLTHRNLAFMSQHIGDMENLETLKAFENAVEHMQSIFRIQPQAVICDQHPGYLSANWAEKFANENHVPLIRVQHHQAHIASVMAENGVPENQQVIGFSFDGTGYGLDRTIWGGEVFVGGYRGFERAAHLAYMPIPGGDAAIKRPYRLALAYMWACGIDWQTDLPPVQHCTKAELRILQQQLEKNLNVIQTSSMGRLFDAVAALLGVCVEVTYEGQAAIELESIAAGDVTESYLVDLSLHPALILNGIITDLCAGVPNPIIAAKFHNTISHIIVNISIQLRQQHKLDTVTLSGGVFQNVHVLRQTVHQLRQYGFEVLTHRLVPPNDGGLSLGQAVMGHFLRQE